MNNKLNPFDKTLALMLRGIGAASVGVRVIQQAMRDFDLTQTEVEVLITVTSYRKPIPLDDIFEDRPYLTRDIIKRALLVLHTKQLIVLTQVIDHEDYIYSTTGNVKAVFKAYDRDRFNEPPSATYVEAIVKPTEVLELEHPVEDNNVTHRIFDLLEALKIGYPNIAGYFARGTGDIDWSGILEVVAGEKVVNTDPLNPMVITPKLDTTLGFCYALLGPEVDANKILLHNPAVAQRAHRAIYERRERDESYDAMMYRIHPNGVPLPGPAPEPRRGLVATIFQAVRYWANGR